VDPDGRGIAINVVGDTANLFNSSLGGVGFVLDAFAWPASILLLSMCVWFRPGPTDPWLRRGRAPSSSRV